MSDSSGVANSWTDLTPEERDAETPRPVESHEDTLSHSAKQESTVGRPREDAYSDQHSPSVTSQQASWEEVPEEGEGVADLSPDSTHDPLGSLINDPETHGQSGVLAESRAPPPDPDSFSDSYTHVSSSPDLEQHPASEITPELQEEVGLVPEEEGPGQDVHPDEGLRHDKEPDLEVRRTADARLDADAAGELEGVSGVRRRRGSLLAAVERIGREEEEEDEEEFRIPQPREEEYMGFSLNKCILGTVILLGIGTIFFSGVFMDIDDEGDQDAKKQRDADAQGKQEWLNAGLPPLPVDVSSTDHLNQLPIGDPEIAVLHAQLLKEELTVAQRQAEEAVKERMKREEMEQVHVRLTKEVASLPVLLKENEKMRKELESVAVLQKEVETLRSTVAELSQVTAKEEIPPPVAASVAPPSGQAGDDTPDGQKERWRKEKVPFQTHRRPPLEHPDYWSQQRERLRHQLNPVTHCISVDVCARAEGLQPVTMPEFQTLLLDYLSRAEGRGAEAAWREELSELVAEFFRDGVFVHDQLSFRDFVEDVDDILEDMVDGDDDDNDEIDDEMDGFEEEALSKFAIPGGREREKMKMKGGRGQA
ncbi:hypothetical protein DPEC_G00142170 [Dallia pectoralis]|uniref:Uncharacterized protein n=1 Tax=Dallia pectoralis TaxID=75939 RepID=A0ACC2GN15_DALPE|nr:hypothetical protein DPEC_G00142170 [Dallia pectoralis]